MNSIQEEFKKRKRNQIIGTIIVSIAMVVVIITEGNISPVVIIIGVVIFSFKNWRCPNCNKYLGKSLSPKFCQHCGEELV